MLEDDYSNSSLVFTNNQKVYFDELYQLNFPSKMVVLSACSTGLGTQESGEGIMSLSRALAYSGVKSSVYSLWQVPDKETSEIMISVSYTHLDVYKRQEGLPVGPGAAGHGVGRRRERRRDRGHGDDPRTPQGARVRR